MGFDRTLQLKVQHLSLLGLILKFAILLCKNNLQAIHFILDISMRKKTNLGKMLDWAHLEYYEVGIRVHT